MSHALPQETPNDIIKSGGYTIQHCGSFTSQVEDALENIGDVLQPAVWDTHYGTTSPPYQAFFKSSYFEIIVENLLKEISIGAPTKLDNGEKLVPRLVCVLKSDVVILHYAGQDADVYDVCKQDPSLTIIHYTETSEIFICPLFFQLPAQPSAGNCPTVNETTNRFEGNSDAFWRSQMYFLLHELVHFYLGLSVEEWVEGGTNEAMDWNYAFSLSPAKAALNALNYVLYVASVDKECRNYPRPDQSRPYHGRRLGATLNLLNVSSAEAPEGHGLDLVHGGISPVDTNILNTTLVGKNLTL